MRCLSEWRCRGSICKIGVWLRWAYSSTWGTMTKMVIMSTRRGSTVIGGQQVFGNEEFGAGTLVNKSFVLVENQCEAVCELQGFYHL